MWLHEIINKVNLSGEVLDARPDDNELEQWKQVIHAPLVFTAEVPLYHLTTSELYYKSVNNKIYLQLELAN